MVINAFKNAPIVIMGTLLIINVNNVIKDAHYALHHQINHAMPVEMLP